MAIGVRVRFEVFKRDEFTCQYCGRKSPEVVLQVDHIVPIAGGGDDDPINLLTSCWECNSGKSDKPLTAIVTGEDPHDRAIMLLERERQLREYNDVLEGERQRREFEGWDLVAYWKRELGFQKEEDLNTIGKRDWRWLFTTLSWCPREKIRDFMDLALARGFVRDFRYVAACCRNWRAEHSANQDVPVGPAYDAHPLD